jgi:ribosomal protein S19
MVSLVVGVHQGDVHNHVAMVPLVVGVHQGDVHKVTALSSNCSLVNIVFKF